MLRITIRLTNVGTGAVKTFPHLDADGKPDTMRPVLEERQSLKFEPVDGGLQSWMLLDNLNPSQFAQFVQGAEYTMEITPRHG